MIKQIVRSISTTAACPHGRRTLATLTLAAALSMTGCGDKSDPKTNSSDSTTGGAHGADTGAHTHAAGESAGAHQHSTKLEFLSAPTVIKAGEPATWTLKIVDAQTGAPVADFDRVHEKLMHLLLISSDLSWFNHLHPEYKGEGVFTISAVLPKAGSYKLYADYTPKGKTQEVAQYELATDGATPAPSTTQLVTDTVGEGGWMLRPTASAPEGEPDKQGNTRYTVALMPMPMKLVSGKDMMLHFQVRDAAGKPVDDLQPYLGAMGHLVVLSGDTKTFLHAHPMEGGMEGMDHGSMDHGGAAHSDSGSAPHEHAAPTKGGPDVIFHTNFPTPGLYKVWGQFQHKGQIITAPFTIEVS